MKITRNKAVTLVTIILLSLMVSSIFTVNVNAATGPGEQYAYISLNPPVIGAGQTVHITVFCQRYVGAVGNPASSFFHNFTVFVYRPDNKVDYLFHIPNVDPDWVCWDSTASAYTTYVPDITGNYTFMFWFPNQTHLSSQPYYTTRNFTASLLVRNESIVSAIDSYPLPSEYWYRPIESQNSWWAGYEASVTSNWCNSVRDRNYNGNPNNRYQPDGIAPESAHIMWAAPVTEGPNNIDPSAYYNQPILNTTLMWNGYLYYPTPDSLLWRQVDLRTGQLINATKNFYPIQSIWAYDGETENCHGVLQAGFFATENYTRMIETTNLQIGHGWTWTMANYPTHGVEAVGAKGEQMKFWIINQGSASSPDWAVRDWNTSKVFNNPSTTWSLTSATSSTNSSTFSARITTRGGTPVVLANDTTEVGIYTVTDMYNLNFTQGTLLCRNGTMPSAATGTTGPITFSAIALYNETVGNVRYLRGNLIWMKTINAPSDGSSLVQGPCAEGVFTLVSPETGTWYGYDLFTGNLLWTTEPQTNYTPYGYTAPTTATGSTVSIGDHEVDPTTSQPILYSGKLFTAGMGGVVFCYDLASGTMLWHKAMSLPYTANIVNYPTHIGLICNGKVYLGTYNPSANEPLLSDSMIRCLNTTDGSEIWSMPGFGSPGGYSVSDGYMVFANYYDMNVYCIGKGPSALTLNSAPDVALSGSSVTLTGTCLDMSPGAETKGTAAISDESMGAWMAYKYMGQPMPTDVTGVTVYLSTIDPNNNQNFIGTATVNPDGTYNCEWTPPVSGTYQLTAQFLGSNSYYPSTAHSTLYVSDQAVTTSNPTAAPQPTMTNTYLAASAGAILATLIAVVVVILLMLRKKP